MKGVVLVLAFIAFFACAKAQLYEQIMSYEYMTEGALSNLTSQMLHENASLCIKTTHKIADDLYALIYKTAGLTDYLINVRNLLMRFIDDIDYCPDIMPVITRIIEVFAPLVTDTYHFIWKLANNIATNGIDIYYHIGYAMKKLKNLSGNREVYFVAGSVLGDMVFDIFFSS